VALAAALVEMVSGISLSQQPVDRTAIEQRRVRALELRNLALALADADADAYRAVLAVQRRRDETGHAGRLREALHAGDATGQVRGGARGEANTAAVLAAAVVQAADPLVSIIEAAGEVTRLAADATGQVRGAARGEANTAAVLAAAVVHAGAADRAQSGKRARRSTFNAGSGDRARSVL
jgi:hypothetical protein